jgi:hypothetical protein
MKIDSTKVEVNATAGTIFTFLKDSNNLIHLLLILNLPNPSAHSKYKEE